MLVKKLSSQLPTDSHWLCVDDNYAQVITGPIERCLGSKVAYSGLAANSIIQNEPDKQDLQEGNIIRKLL